MPKINFRPSLFAPSLLMAVFAQTEAQSFNAAEKAGVCAGYHSAYAMISNSQGAMNDRDHSVRVVTNLDSNFGRNEGYTRMKNVAVKALTDALRTRQNLGVINEMIGYCREVGAPTAMNTGR